MHDGHHHHHDHDHDHVHEEYSMEEAIALLKYMADHNKSHTAELEEIADQFEDTARDLIEAAVEQYSAGNTLLDQALAEIGQ